MWTAREPSTGATTATTARRDGARAGRRPGSRHPQSPRDPFQLRGHLMSDLIPAPPVAKKVPFVTELHGDVRRDDYAWLRVKDDPEVTAYLEAENAYTDAVMKPTVEFREALYTEMLARIKEDDQSVPFVYGGWLYYSRTETGKQYPIHCRKRTDDAAEEVTLDLNQLAEGHAFLALGAYAISDDGRWLAYSVDYTGFREYTLFVKDLLTGELQ